MSQNQPTNTPTPSWRELREQEREERRAARGENGWVFGAVLILIGVLLFLQNMNTLTLHNWWALFILIPAFGALAGAWRLYSRDKEISAPVLGAFMSGLLFLGVALVFLFNLAFDWARLLPALLIVFGVSLLLPAVFGKRQ